MGIAHAMVNEVNVAGVGTKTGSYVEMDKVLSTL
jgi:hypothetical protein